MNDSLQYIQYKPRGVQYNRKPLFIGSDGLCTVDGVIFRKNKSTEGKQLIQKSYVKIERLLRDIKPPARELHERFTEYAEDIYHHSKHQIDMLRTGDEVQTALHFFMNLPKVKQLDADGIKESEIDIMNNCSKSDLIYAEKYTGPLFKYDIKSLYPWLLKNNKFPIKEGHFETLEELPKDLKYGFYRAVLKSSHWSFKTTSKSKWITHIDIQSSRKLGKKVKRISIDCPSRLKSSS